MKPLFRETENKRYLEVIGHYDNPILCAKLTLLADMFAIEHKEGYAKFRIEDEDKLSFIDRRLEFGDVGGDVDLTNTTWLINDEPSFSQRLAYSINFTSNNTSYSGFGVSTYPSGNGEPVINDALIYGDGSNYGLKVLDVSFGLDGNTYSWSNNAYKTITITGGTDATNPDLLVWLTENATQVSAGITDLTNTTWLFDEDDIWTDTFDNIPYPIISLTFTSNNQEFNGIDIEELDSDQFMSYRNSQTSTDIRVYVNGWSNSAYRTINITGGTDATNVTVIDWLKSYATQVQPTPTPSTGIFLGNLPIQSISLGNLPVQKIFLGNIEIYSGGDTPTPITDLTGTTWLLDDILDVDDLNEDWSINFSSNNGTFKTLSPYDDIGQEPPVEYLYYTSTNSSVWADVTAYEDGVWTEDGYKTITITGGTDATNTDLIAWLQDNATQVSEEITDLTNTTWLFNNSLDNSAEGQWFIDFSSNNNTYNILSPSSGYLDYINYDFESDSHETYHAYVNGTWTAEADKTIHITGGSDVTNSDLIAWLQENATQQS